jgi:hypothetical protein
VLRTGARWWRSGGVRHAARDAGGARETAAAPEATILARERDAGNALARLSAKLPDVVVLRYRRSRYDDIADVLVGRTVTAAVRRARNAPGAGGPIGLDTEMLLISRRGDPSEKAGVEADLGLGGRAPAAARAARNCPGHAGGAPAG